MYFTTFEYHEADTRPVNNRDLDIFGLELEISDSSLEVQGILDELIRNDELTAPVNAGQTRNWKVIENDSSVFKEIILNADTIGNLLKRVERLNDYGLTPDNVINHAGTSAHIHINRAYLEEIGVSIGNLYKCIEFYAPFIYLISGRTPDSWNEWSEPLTPTPLFNIDWERRARQVSQIDPFGYGRYHLVNLENSNTVEMRGFSNVYSFDWNIICLYLKTIQFFIDTAEKMKGRYYKDSAEFLLNELKQFIKKNPAKLSRFNLFQLFLNAPVLDWIKREQNNNRLKRDLNHYARFSGNPVYFVDTIYHQHPNIWEQIRENLNLSREGIKSISNDLLNDVMVKEYGIWFNAYRQILHQIRELI